MARVAIKTLGGDGPDIVLLHGFGADRLSWLANSSALLALGRVHAVDLPAHGDSEPDVGTAHPEDLALRIREALAAHGIATPHLVGHSLGGGLALMLAAADPGHVASLALIAPLGLGQGVDQTFLTAFPNLTETEPAMTLLRRLVVRPALINKLTAERTLAQLAKPGVRAAVSRIATEIVAHQPLFAAAARQVAANAIPRLLLWGDEDRINPADPVRLAAFGGQSHMLHNAGHLPHIEMPAAANAALTQFLRQAKAE